MDKAQKKLTVENLKASFKDSEGVVVTHYLGLNSSELTELRTKIKEVGAKFCVAKNSLVKIATKNTAYEGLNEYFSGPTALVFSKDPKRLTSKKYLQKFDKKFHMNFGKRTAITSKIIA